MKENLRELVYLSLFTGILSLLHFYGVSFANLPQAPYFILLYAFQFTLIYFILFITLYFKRNKLEMTYVILGGFTMKLFIYLIFLFVMSKVLDENKKIFILHFFFSYFLLLMYYLFRCYRLFNDKSTTGINT